jgi:hypothetical protein
VTFAQLGTDGTVGGPGGSPLASSVALTGQAKTFSAAQTFGAQICFGMAGAVWQDAPTFDAGGSGGAQIRFQTELTTKNGINVRSGLPAGTPTPADSITSDASNAAGTSFFFNDYRVIIHGGAGASNSKGSGQIYTAQGVITDTGDGGNPKYRELGLYEATLTADSAGAYTCLMEGATTLTAGKPSRANGVAILINDANPLSSYAATVGSTSIYADTGARAFAAENIGPQHGGTAYHVYGEFVRGLLCTFFTETNNVFESRAQNAVNPYVEMNGVGAISWGAGGASAVDVSLSRGAAGVLTLSGSLDLLGTGVVYLPGGYLNFNGNAFASYTTATAGAAPPLPATPAGYFMIVDHAGITRKVPYYAD